MRVGYTIFGDYRSCIIIDRSSTRVHRVSSYTNPRKVLSLSRVRHQFRHFGAHVKAVARVLSYPLKQPRTTQNFVTPLTYIYIRPVNIELFPSAFRVFLTGVESE